MIVLSLKEALFFYNIGIVFLFSVLNYTHALPRKQYSIQNVYVGFIVGTLRSARTTNQGLKNQKSWYTFFRATKSMFPYTIVHLNISYTSKCRSYMRVYLLLHSALIMFELTYKKNKRGERHYHIHSRHPGD